MKSKNSPDNVRWQVLILAVIVIASAAYIYSMTAKKAAPITDIPSNEKVLYPFSGSSNAVQMNLPAINLNDTGVSAKLTVSVKKGTGNIFFGIGNALTNPDTQQSARTAALYATEHEGVSLETVDIMYDIRASASMIEGPSAGAALAISTIAALRNKTLSGGAMITGAINHDGTIGPSGKILEKAQVAKKQGAKVFLAPVGSLSEIQINYTEEEFCREWGGYEYCQPEFKPKIINATKEAGIQIIEVATVDDALKYFM